MTRELRTFVFSEEDIDRIESEREDAYKALVVERLYDQGLDPENFHIAGMVEHRGFYQEDDVLTSTLEEVAISIYEPTEEEWDLIDKEEAEECLLAVEAYKASQRV